MIAVGSADLSSAIADLSRTNAQLYNDIMKDAKDELEGAWIPALAARSTNAQDRSVIIAGAKAVVGSTGFFMFAAQSEAPLSGGFVPYKNWFAVEIGARNRKATFPQRSRKGKVYTVTKTINRGLPNRQKYPRVAYDASSEVGTELVRLWVRSIVGRYREVFGDGR